MKIKLQLSLVALLLCLGVSGFAVNPRAPTPTGVLLSAVQVQHSRCADCHFANLDAPARDHLMEWDRSPHGRDQVGCESCHGGDPTTFDPFGAHRDVLNSRNPASPANRRNLPRTCGRCHVGPYVAFQKSLHLALLEDGDKNVPTCSTCHGAVGAHLLSPRAIEVRCASCHSADGIAPWPGYADEAPLLVERIGIVRSTLDEALSLIRHERDAQRKASFEYEYQQAEIPLMEATDAGHAFEFTAVEAGLALAKQRADALLERILGS